MGLGKVRLVRSEAELIEIIHNAASSGGDVWQSGTADEAGKHICKILSVQVIGSRIALKLSHAKEINFLRPLFIRFNYRKMLFKVYPEDFIIKADILTCSLPEQTYALDKRKGGERYVLPRQANFSMSIKRIERTMREISFEIEVRIVDVSRMGFGIVISEFNRDYFQENDHFLLRAINHSHLKHSLQGTVCYVKGRGEREKGEVRIGLSLRTPLEDEAFESLKKHSLYILGA